MEQDTKELFARYGDMIYRIAMSYRNSVPFAEDMVQEVFVRYLRKRPRFENREHEKAWFIRVAANCCKSTLSSAWFRRVCPLEEAGQMAAPLGSGEECVLYELLCTLPAKYRIVLYLRYYEEYSVGEIGEIMGVRPALVSTWLARGREKLKAILGGKWNGTLPQTAE